MKRWESRSSHLATLLVAATGLCYGWFKYFGSVQGEFGPEPHPLQTVFQHLHVLAAPLEVFMLGILMKGHVLPKLNGKGKKGRRTGILAGLLFTSLLMAGYGIQASTAPGLRLALGWIHGVSGLLVTLAYGAHLVVVLKRPARAPKPIARPHRLPEFQAEPFDFDPDRTLA